MAAQPLPQQGDGEERAEDDGGHAQHLEESSVLHEAEADVAQHRAHQLYHSSLQNRRRDYTVVSRQSSPE